MVQRKGLCGAFWAEGTISRDKANPHELPTTCTMSLYLAHPAIDDVKQAISPAVQDKGLSYLKAKPSDVHIICIPSELQPGFACYAANISAFITATLTGKHVAIANRGYPTPVPPMQLPWKYPPTIYDFPKAPNDRKKDMLRAHSQVIVGKKKEVSFVMSEPTIELVRSVVNDGAREKTLHMIGTINIDALKMVMILRRILSGFLLTHTYPAFRHVSDLNPSEEPQVATAMKRRKVDNTSYVTCIDDVEQHVNDPDELPAEKPELPQPPNPVQYIQLRYAKPTRNPVRMWGSVENIPNASGIYVPYVKELAAADGITVPRLMATTFIRSFARTIGGSIAQIEEFNKAWGVIHTSDLGHQISHICRCIEIALRCQAAVYLVYSGNIYEGTVICGAGFTLGLHGRVYKPIAFEELQQVVRDRSAHAKALAGINEKAGGMNEEIDKCTSIRGLSALLCDVELDTEARTDIVKLAHNLSYPGRYWSSSVVNVKAALGYLQSTDEIPNDVPMHPKYMFTTDRVESVMSAFGHQAPTFMIPNGRRYNLDNREPPQNFHVRTVGIDSAVTDMKYVMQHGLITNNPGNLASKHRDTPLKAQDKMEVWTLLKSVYDTGNQKPAATDVGQGSVPESGDKLGDDLW